ncbi:MAG TPA: VOC family protein [Acidimicrobiia bacterium]|jgi:4a-hydroxytetrahydrobiopterin dehydratase
MSEQGWRDFLAVEGLDDWVVLHGGATAVFRISPLAAAIAMAADVARIPGVPGGGVILTIGDGVLAVRLSRDLWQLEGRHVDLARAISTTAREHGALADRQATQEVQLAISGKPASIDVAFWRAVLGYAPMADDNAVDPLGHGSTVWMQQLAEEKPLRHAMHIDVSVAREVAESRLAAALAAGGRIVAADEGGWTLADAAGNRVCIAAWPDGFKRTEPISA